jgi:hypothetical protein
MIFVRTKSQQTLPHPQERNFTDYLKDVFH